MHLTRIHNNRFLKDASMLTVGTATAQFLPILIYPILSRIYAPEQFAVLAAFTSLITILQVISSCKYEYAILIADKDIDAANIFCLALTLNIALMLIIYSVFGLVGVEFTFKYSSGLKQLIWLVPLGAFFLNIFNCYNEWCVRKQYFKKLSLNKVTNSVLVSLGKYGLYYTIYNTIGLTLGDFFGRFLTAFICMLRILIQDYSTFKCVTISGVVKQAKYYIQFPIYTMPAQLMNSVAAAIPIFVLSYYYSPDKVGFFSMTMSVLLVPINVISLAVRDVFRKRANDLYKIQGKFDELYKKLFLILFVITCFVCIIIAPFLPLFFGFLLGKQWEEVGSYSQILLPMIGMDFIAMSLSGGLIVTQKLKQLFVWQSFFCFITLITLVITSYFHSPIELTLLSFSIGRFIAYLYLIIISYYYSKGN